MDNVIAAIKERIGRLETHIKDNNLDPSEFAAGKVMAYELALQYFNEILDTLTESNTQCEHIVQSASEGHGEEGCPADYIGDCKTHPTKGMCNECGFLHKKGNVVYESNGSRPTRRSCNKS